MAQLAGQFWPVGDIVRKFVACGCTVREAEPTVMFEDGDCLNVRYLLNPKTGGFAAIQDLLDTDSVSRDEVEFWERRLGVSVLPKAN